MPVTNYDADCGDQLDQAQVLLEVLVCGLVRPR
jgi:hypothetical protein